MDDLIQQYITDKEDFERAKLVQDEYKADMEATKAAIRAKLEELGMKSAKTDLGSVSVVEKPKLAIVNEAQVIQWMKEEPTIEEDLYMSLNKRALEPVLKEWVKQTGEVVTGVESQTTEYLSVRPKEAKNGKV